MGVTKCLKIIAPNGKWRTKEFWDILDVCDFLDNGGLGLNTVQSLSFLQIAGLLDKAERNGDEPAFWLPEQIRSAADSKVIREEYRANWARLDEIFGPTLYWRHGLDDLLRRIVEKGGSVGYVVAGDDAETFREIGFGTKEGKLAQLLLQERHEINSIPSWLEPKFIESSNVYELSPESEWVKKI